MASTLLIFVSYMIVGAIGAGTNEYLRWSERRPRRKAREEARALGEEALAERDGAEVTFFERRRRNKGEPDEGGPLKP